MANRCTVLHGHTKQTTNLPGLIVSQDASLTETRHTQMHTTPCAEESFVLFVALRMGNYYVHELIIVWLAEPLSTSFSIVVVHRLKDLKI